MAGLVSTFAGTGNKACKDGPGSHASFSYPCGIDINQNDGCVYVADSLNHKIKKITPQGYFLFS